MTDYGDDDDMCDDDDTCLECGGEGVIYEDEYECDWVNFGHTLIACPECGGTGYYTD